MKISGPFVAGMLFVFVSWVFIWPFVPPDPKAQAQTWNLTVTLNEPCNGRGLVVVSNNVTHSVFMTNVLITAYEKPN